MLPFSKTLAEALTLPGPPTGAHCMWLGQSGFLLRIGGQVVVIDPFLSDHPDRLVPPMGSPEDFEGVDLVIGTHDHIDHIDRNAWKEIGQSTLRCRFAVPSILLPKLAHDLSIPLDRFIGLDAGCPVIERGLRLIPIPAAHEFFQPDPATGRFPFLGVVLEGGGVTIYHAGDTCIYSGLAERLILWPWLDLAIIPINGRDAARYRQDVMGNMTYQEAADLAGFVRPGLTVPCHWDMFPHNLGDPESFADYMQAKYPELAVKIPEHGELFELHVRVNG